MVCDRFLKDGSIIKSKTEWDGLSGKTATNKEASVFCGTDNISPLQSESCTT